MQISYHLPVSIVPSSRAELLIRTIAETYGTVDLWHARSTMTNARQAACGDEHFRENCSVH